MRVPVGITGVPVRNFRFCRGAHLSNDNGEDEIDTSQPMVVIDQNNRIVSKRPYCFQTAKSTPRLLKSTSDDRHRLHRRHRLHDHRGLHADALR